MPTPLLHAGNQITCLHSGQGEVIFSNFRVSTRGNYFMTLADVCSIAGCKNPPAAGPMCAVVQFAMPATRVFICGQPALLQSSMGTCAPTGTPAIVAPAPPASFVGGM